MSFQVQGKENKCLLLAEPLPLGPVKATTPPTPPPTPPRDEEDEKAKGKARPASA